MISEIILNFLFPFKIRMEYIEYDELKKYLLSGKSIIRWGDGEVNLMKGKSISFQESSMELKKQLEISYFEHHDDLLIASPYMFLESNVFDLLTKKKFKIWYKTRAFFIMNKHKFPSRHADAFGFRKETNQAYFPILKLICAKKKIYLISSEHSDVMIIKKYLNVEDVKHISVPRINSFSEYECLKGKINDMQDHNSLILSAAGPVSKVLAKDAVKKSIQFIDVGHFFSHMEQN